MVAMMNSGHGAMDDGGFDHIAISGNVCILDVGCGGGANIKKLLAKAPKGQVKGIAYSEVGVEKLRKVHRITKPGGTFFICNESNGETNTDDKWVEKIGGMTVYNGNQIVAALQEEGFLDTQMDKDEKGWICVTARK